MLVAFVLVLQDTMDASQPLNSTFVTCQASSSSRASSSSDLEKSAVRQAAVDQSTMSMAEAPQHFPSDESSCQAGR